MKLHLVENRVKSFQETLGYEEILAQYRNILLMVPKYFLNTVLTFSTSSQFFKYFLILEAQTSSSTILFSIYSVSSFHILKTLLDLSNFLTIKTKKFTVRQLFVKITFFANKSFVSLDRSLSRLHFNQVHQYCAIFILYNLQVIRELNNF